jgi:hypothetical protein
MGIAEDLKSLDPAIIKNTLNSLLNAVTQDNVLDTDCRFQAIQDREAQIKFLKNLETSDPGLLERWAHYCWLRLELSYLANQRATLNYILDAKQKDPIQFPVAESIRSAIQEDFLSDTPIKQSIATLRKVTLQIVGTEHPTDPLSQSARDAITDIANEMEKTDPSEENIKALLECLQQTDAIPPFKRNVEEEVNRNISMVLDKLYDGLPQFIQSILDAYQQSYGEELFKQHKEEILQALEGGLQPKAGNALTTPIARDASWAGFDADGNVNVTPNAMRNAIQLHRTRAAEKHIASLQKIIESSKDAELELRKQMFQLCKNQMACLLEATQEKSLIQGLYDAQMEIASALANKNYNALVDHLMLQSQNIEGLKLPTDHLQNNMKSMHQEQYQKAILLKKLTRFSGAYRVTNTTQDQPKQKNRKLEEGDLQKLQALFQQCKERIRNNTDAIEIDSEGNTLTQTEYALRQYRQIMEDHRDLLDSFPELQLPMRCFGIQLSCFGMTYGAGHIRQDSSIFIKVWSALLNDLCKEEPFLQFSLFNELKTKGYQGLSQEERTHLHKRLRADDPEGQQVLRAIYTAYQSDTYRKQPKYQAQPDFAWVCMELERVELALRHSDMFENIIISNCESAANILEVESLLNIFGPKHQMTVVPLLEKRQDLENYEHILDDFIKMQRDLGKRVVEVMVGYSDTERVSGLPALLSIQEVQEKIIELAAKYGLKVKIYHGPGGDANRGGLERNDEKGTLQGNARSNRLTTPQSTARFREIQFYRAYKDKGCLTKRKEFAQLPEPLREKLTLCKEQGAAFYEHLHDPENGLGQLLGFTMGQGAHWMVDILNSSSRVSQRGMAESHGDRTISVQTGGIRPKGYIKLADSRAITATQMKELLRDNIHLVMGPGRGLRAIDQQDAEWLYHFSDTFRDMIDKTAMGLKKTDFDITGLALFGENSEFLPKDDEQRRAWAEECRTQYPDRLQGMNIEEMVKESKNRPELLKMCSRLLAYIMEESLQTKIDILRLQRAVHSEKYHPTPQSRKVAAWGKHDATYTEQQANDLLAHYPEWQQQEERSITDARAPQILIALQNSYVAQGINLDEVYQGLNEVSSPHGSKLSGVGRILGNTGAALTAARIMPPAFYEKKLHQPAKTGLKSSVKRALLGRLEMYGLSGRSTFFNEARGRVQQALGSKSQRGEARPCNNKG